MGFIVNKKTEIQVIMVLSEITDIIIAIIVNLITQTGFNFCAIHNLVLCGIFVLLITAHIICIVIQHDASLKARNKKLQKAFQEHGGYDAVAEEMKECIKHRDYRSMKDLKKMVDLVEK